MIKYNNELLNYYIIIIYYIYYIEQFMQYILYVCLYEIRY